MKIVTISFPEATDISSLTIGLTPVTVGVVGGGEVMMIGSLPDAIPGASLTHVHDVATPNAETSPPIG